MSATSPSDRRIRVAIAEDDDLVRETLAELLEARGFDVVGRASEGGEAVDLVRRTSPDIVILDVRMPGMGGIDTARAISGLRLPTRIVALSAYEDPALQRSMLAAGAVDYLTKGLPTAELCERLRRAVAEPVP